MTSRYRPPRIALSWGPTKKYWTAPSTMARSRQQARQPKKKKQKKQKELGPEGFVSDGPKEVLPLDRPFSSSEPPILPTVDDRPDHHPLEHDQEKEDTKEIIEKEPLHDEDDDKEINQETKKSQGDPSSPRDDVAKDEDDDPVEVKPEPKNIKKDTFHDDAVKEEDDDEPTKKKGQDDLYDIDDEDDPADLDNYHRGEEKQDKKKNPPDDEEDDDDFMREPDEEEEGDDTEKKPAPATAGEEASEEPLQVLTSQTFAELGLRPVLVEACQRLEWNTATRIQAEVLPVALQGRDVIGLAETGSGKTGAFCLPLLQLLLLGQLGPTTAQPSSTARGGGMGKLGTAGLILTPTRELAFQIQTVLQGLGKETLGLKSVCIVGGVDKTSQALALAQRPHVIVATPGRLLDHLTQTKGFHLQSVRYLVLDEADRMLGLDFEEELHQILDQLPAGSDRQTLLFSATMTSQVQKLQRASLRPNPVRIQIHTGNGTKFATPANLQQHYLFIPAKYKDCYLTYLINEYAGQSILVFGATCRNVQRWALMLRHLGFPAVCLHGQMSQPQRLGALNKFASGQRTILICTDVASRGLDLPSVDWVIQADLPGHGKEYIHRVGRTARAGKAGRALAMVTQYDVEIYQRIEGLLGRKLPEYSTDEETVLVLLERVSEAQRLATRELKEQLAAQRGRRRKSGDEGGDEGPEDEGLEAGLQKELKRSYAGGSGGRGGALPNQRGSATKAFRKKPRRH